MTFTIWYPRFKSSSQVRNLTHSLVYPAQILFKSSLLGLEKQLNGLSACFARRRQGFNSGTEPEVAKTNKNKQNTCSRFLLLLSLFYLFLGIYLLMCRITKDNIVIFKLSGLTSWCSMYHKWCQESNEDWLYTKQAS